MSSTHLIIPVSPQEFVRPLVNNLLLLGFFQKQRLPSHLQPVRPLQAAAGRCLRPLKRHPELRGCEQGGESVIHYYANKAKQNTDVII